MFYSINVIFLRFLFIYLLFLIFPDHNL